MKKLIATVVLSATVAGCAAHAGFKSDYVDTRRVLAPGGETFRWRKVADVPDDVSIAIVDTPPLQLRSLANRFEPYNGRSRKGFSILLRNRETGAYRCVIYVLDAGDKETIEHERLHCQGWDHK